MGKPKKVNTETILKNETQWPFILLIAFYSIIFLISKGVTLGPYGIQLIGINLVNIVAAIYLFLNKTKYINNLNNLTKLPVIILVIFSLSQIISVFYADDFYNALFEIIKFLTIISSAFLIIFFLSDINIKTIKTLVVFFGIILFLETFFGLTEYLNTYRIREFSGIKKLLRANSENVNFQAVLNALRICFVLLGIYLFEKKYTLLFHILYFLGILTVFLITSRATFIALTIITILFGVFLTYNKRDYKNVGVLILSFFLAYFISLQSSKRLIEEEVSKKTVTTITTSDESSYVRLLLWGNSIELIKQKPIIGHGLGSYQNKTIPLESKQRIAWRISKYPHNDFLQTYAETGIIGFLSLLILLILVGLKSLRLAFSKNNEESTFALLILMLSIAYGVVSFLNFPRGVVAVFFNFALIIALSSWMFKNKFSANKNLFFIVPIIGLINLLMLYPNNLYRKSLIGQNLVLADDQDFKLIYQEVKNMIPIFPPIGETGMAINAQIFKYLAKERQNIEDLNNFKNQYWSNSNLRYADNQIVMFYDNKNEQDSVTKYFKRLFEMYPLVETTYANYVSKLAYNKDTTNIIKAINYYDGFLQKNRQNTINRIEPTLTFVSTKFLIDAGYPLNKIEQKFERQLKLYEQDSLINILNNNFKKFREDQKIAQPAKKVDLNNWDELVKKYETLLNNNPDKPSYQRDLAASYFKTNQPKKAIPLLEKLLASDHYINGEVEFLLGVCYINTKQKEKGCELIKKATQRGYQV